MRLVNGACAVGAYFLFVAALVNGEGGWATWYGFLFVFNTLFAVMPARLPGDD
jgi:hypothetical protein